MEAFQTNNILKCIPDRAVQQDGQNVKNYKTVQCTNTNI